MMEQFFSTGSSFDDTAGWVLYATVFVAFFDGGEFSGYLILLAAVFF